MDIEAEKERHFSFIMQTFVNKLPSDVNFKCLHSSAAHYVDFVSGGVDLVLECTRKGNLEMAVAYGLVVESGGVMLSFDGKSLGPRRYLKFGQEKYTPIITASTKQLAKELIKYLD